MDGSFDRFLVRGTITIKDAMRLFGQVGEKILYVTDDQLRLLGAVSDGDVRRWVLAGGDLLADIGQVYNNKPTVVREGWDKEKVKALMLKEKLQSIPVLGPGDRVQDVLLWDSILGGGVPRPKGKVNLPVLIMAGGRGTRLDPFTKVLPKPLVPVGDQTIMELIMSKFRQHGVNEFFISINHKSRMIKAYFEEAASSYKLHYIEEKKPLGTIGSLRLLHNKVKDSLFVSNCDVIIDADYSELVTFHEEKGYDLTLVGSFRHYTIPYGICTIENGGTLVDIQEKPEQDFLVNTGMYLIRKEIIRLIPRDREFSIIDLIDRIKEQGGKVGVFPVDERSWVDVGEWKEFRRAVKMLDLGQ